MFLVIGATGNIGKQVVGALAGAGAGVRALVRDPGKAAVLLGGKVALYRGDLAHPDTLEPALAGVQKALLLSSADPEQVRLQGNVIRAARQAGVRHVVKMSVIGASLESPVALARWHALTEKELESSGLPYTHLRAHFFMQNVLMFSPSIARQNVFHAPMGDGAISMVDLRDVAAVAAAVLTQSGHEGKAYEVTGPEALSFWDVAAKLSVAVGRSIQYVDVPVEHARREMRASRMPDWLAESLLGMYGLFRAGCGAAVTNVVREVAGRVPRTFDAFAHECVPTFAGQRTRVASRPA